MSPTDEAASTGPAGARTRIAWREATVAHAELETPRARTLHLDVPGWPGHRAGQHVDIRLTAEDGYQAQRSYSISSSPENPRVAITVELVEDGEVSPYLVQDVLEGDVLELRGPVGGHFTWSADDDPGRPVLLVGGGSGLAPLMSMARHHAIRGSATPMTILASARSPQDALYREELGDRATWTFTRSAPAGWTGYARRVDGDMLAEVAPAPDRGPECFLCGPTPFVEAVSSLLVAAGHEPNRIHAERFGPTGG